MPHECFAHLTWALDPKRVFIHLRRRNRIKAVVSKIHAIERTAVCNNTEAGWAATSGHNCDILPFAIRPARLIEMLKIRESQDEQDTMFMTKARKLCQSALPFPPFPPRTSLCIEGTNT